MPKKSKESASIRKETKKAPEKETRGEMKSESEYNLARRDQQAGGPDHHGLEADEDRNP